MNKSSLFSIAILLLVIGCAPTRPLNTASGKPDVTIPHVTKKQVTDALVSQMLSQGFTIKSSSDYNIVFTKIIDNVAASMLFGSRYDSTPEHRASFMLVETNSGVRVVLTNQIITNPGSAFERTTDANTGEAGASWQNWLLSFTNLFRGRIGVTVDDKGFITNIVGGSPAMESKLLVGDKIISVNGNPFRSTSEISGEPETNVELEILRNNKNIVFNITRKILEL